MTAIEYDDYYYSAIGCRQHARYRALGAQGRRQWHCHVIEGGSSGAVGALEAGETASCVARGVLLLEAPAPSQGVMRTPGAPVLVVLRGAVDGLASLPEYCCYYYDGEQ